MKATMVADEVVALSSTPKSNRRLPPINLGLDSALDLASALIVLAELVGITGRYDLGAVVVALAITGSALLLTRTLVGRKRNRYVFVDYVVIAISLLYIYDLIREPPYGASKYRIFEYFLGISAYWLLRGLSARIVNMVLGVVAFGGVLLSLGAIEDAVAWVARLQLYNFNEPALMKGTQISLLGGPMNEWATIALLGTVVVMYFFPFEHFRPIVGTISVVSLGIMVICVMLTLSRGAYVAIATLFASFTIYVFLYIPCAKKCLIRLYVIFGLAVLCSIILSNRGVVATANTRWTDYERRSADARIEVWSSALHLFRAKPVLGSGPATFAPRFVPLADLGSYKPFVGRPLNTPVEILVEEGLMGLLLYSLLVIGVANRGITSLQRNAKKDFVGKEAWHTAILLSGLGALLVRESTFSSYLESSLVFLLSWIFVAALVNMTQDRTGDRCGESVV